MSDFIKKELCPGAELVSVPAHRFKTNEISVSFLCPLTDSKTASINAVLINMLSHTGAEYPAMEELNKRLAYLYGASLRAGVSKTGENQMLSLSITSLDDRFSLMGKSIALECAELLFSLIFKPNFDDKGDFCQIDIQREKRLVAEKIESEENEKRIYSLNRAQQIMFKGEPFSINKYGTVDDVNCITAAELKDAYKNLIEKSKVRFTVVGSCDTTDVEQMLKEKFASVKRNYVKPQPAVFIPEALKVNNAEERIDVKQGKLVLGFRVNMKSDDKNTEAMRAFCDVFGGGPYSKLFANVREKLSLCYYCSAQYNRRKSCIMIQCGCEEENMDKAVNEILNQLEEIKKGNFDEEFASSKIGLTDMMNGVKDDSLSLLSWYSMQIADDETVSPAQSAEKNDNVTKEQIQRCANLISLDTVYKLTCIKEAE